MIDFYDTIPRTTSKVRSNVKLYAVQTHHTFYNMKRHMIFHQVVQHANPKSRNHHMWWPDIDAEKKM